MRQSGPRLPRGRAFESEREFAWRRISFQRTNVNYLPSDRNLIRNADPEDIWASEAAAAMQREAEADVVSGRAALQPEV